MRDLLFLLYKHKCQQATQHHAWSSKTGIYNNGPIAKAFQLPHLIWEEQKKYTNKSKIRYELEVFISEQRLWSLVSSKVEKETKPVLSAEVHWIFSDVTVFYYFSELSYFVILCAQLTLREVAWHLQRSIGVSPPCSENDNEDDNRCLF